MPITRSEDRVIAGVCGGLAEHLDVEPMVLRTLYTSTLVLFGLGIPLYLVLFLAMEPSSAATPGGPAAA